MGKLKQDDSDNQMDIGDNNNDVMQDENTTKVPKKNKKIAKAKLSQSAQVNQKAKQGSITKDAVKKFAKLVNLKKSQRSLSEKQEIFKKVVKGLHSQKTSKKQRKKSRIMLKKQLHKALERQEKQETKARVETMQSQKSIVQKKRKEPLNEKAEVIKMRSAMGQSLSSLKSMLAQKLG